MQCTDDNLTHAPTVQRRVGRDRILSTIQAVNQLKKSGKLANTAEDATEAKFVDAREKNGDFYDLISG